MSRSTALRSLVTLVCLHVAATAGIVASAAAQSVTLPAAARPAGAPTKTWEKSLVQALKPTPAGVKYQLNVTESPLEAASVAEFTAKMNAATQQMVELKSGRAPGSYQYGLSTPWQTETHLSRCQFKDIDVRITYDADVVMLGGAVAQDSATRAWWEGQLDQLYAKHFERLRLMRDEARTLYQKVRHMTNSSCAELANMATLATRDARFELNEKMRALGGRLAPIADPVTRTP